MPPLRFLQAVLPSLDHVPHSPTRRLASELWFDAPRRAFRRTVDAALAHRVDFLLLFPVPEEHWGSETLSSLGLQTMLEFQRQHTRLAEARIHCIIITDQPEHGWNRLASATVKVIAPATLPTTIDFGSDLAVQFVSHRSPRPTEEQGYSSPGSDAAYTLGVTTGPEDWETRSLPRYIAAGTPTRETDKTAAGLRHSSGLLQAGIRSQTGAHGASLVTLDQRTPQIEFIATASVRLEQFILRVGIDEAIDDLAIRMTERIIDTKAEPSEEAWVVDWLLECEDSRHPLLTSRAVRQDLVSLLPEDLSSVPVCYEVRVERAAARFAEDDPLAQEFSRAIADVERRLQTPAGRLELLDLPADCRHLHQIARLVEKTDAAAVRRLHALTSGMTTDTWTLSERLGDSEPTSESDYEDLG